MRPCIFISHASEDKENVARPLAEQLLQHDMDVWYDDYDCYVGDRLRLTVKRGLSQCDYGVAVLSRSFFTKPWPCEELDTLLARETAEQRELLFPVCHEIDERYAAVRAPALAGRIAISTTVGLRVVAQKIAYAVLQKADKLVLSVKRFEFTLTSNLPKETISETLCRIADAEHQRCDYHRQPLQLSMVRDGYESAMYYITVSSCCRSLAARYIDFLRLHTRLTVLDAVFDFRNAE